MPARTGLLQRGDVVNDTYEVQFHIGEGAFGEVYRVRHKWLGLQVLKVLKESFVEGADYQRFVSESVLLATITHPNVVRVFETNTASLGQRTYCYLTMEFVSGESLAQRLTRAVRLPTELATSIERDMLAGLAAAHEHEPPVLHRDIHAQNILLSYDHGAVAAKLGDFGLAVPMAEATKLPNACGRMAYYAPECFWGTAIPASDIFAAGIVLYEMLTGAHPWPCEAQLDSADPDSAATTILAARKRAPRPASRVNPDCTTRYDSLISKALSADPDKRFSSAAEFAEALRELPKQVVQSGGLPVQVAPAKSTGPGFAGIAGMEELKATLHGEVVRPFLERELYERYKVSIPNGMLFFGPPGCGKTFIARRLAEEIGCTYMEVKPSDIASTYVHGTQEKVGQLFQKAREQAPTVLFFDEVDAILPSREGRLDHSYASEVNEFLAQLTDCHQHEIFVIAATNRPEKIDPAILRTGRLDKVIFIPPPDEHARRELFAMHLQGRPLADIDINRLATQTSGYVASDLSFIVNEAARSALLEHETIQQRHFDAVISRTQPSISPTQLAEASRFAESRSFT